MKITNPNVIKNGEKDLIEAVKDDLDLDAVKEVLKKRMAAAALSSKGGEIVVYNNEIAFRLDFDIHLSGSLMFDRQGNHIPESDETNADEPGNQETDGQESLSSGVFDLDDIDINETLLNNSEDTEIEEEDTPEEELDIDLPDYDLDNELDTESEDHDENKDGDMETEELADSEDNEMALDDLEQLTDDPELESENEADALIEDDLVDEDINDILKESREFWEQKKDS